jgi:cytoskeletal protein CcmA (bactofilin family)
MFSKSDDKSKAGGQTALADVPRGTAGSTVPSLISTDLKVVGNLESAGDLQIDGNVKGDIKSRSVTVGEQAQIKGSITAETVRICGTIDGQVKGNSVTIAKTAKAKGDIVHQTLSIEAGATIEGQIRRLDSEKANGGGKTAGAATETSAATKPATGSSNGGGDKPAVG